MAIPNRKVQWVNEGIRLAPDQRHAEEVIEDLGLCTTSREMTEDEKVPMEEAAASQFRRLVAELHCFSLDGPIPGSVHRWFAPSRRNLGSET